MEESPYRPRDFHWNEILYINALMGGHQKYFLK